LPILQVPDRRLPSRSRQGADGKAGREGQAGLRDGVNDADERRAPEGAGDRTDAAGHRHHEPDDDEAVAG